MTAAAVQVGLTGGIGSGKSTVAGLLKEAGAWVVDADQISRDLTAPGGLGIAAIQAAFGPAFVTASGAMDRQKMRDRVFQDATAKAQLESILHPLIYQETDRQGLLGMAAGHACVVYDLPLLVESPRWRKRLDHVLVIDCSPEVQIERVHQRSGLVVDQIQSIIDQQAPRGVRLAASDSVIANSYLSLAALREQVMAFLTYVTGPFSNVDVLQAS